VCMYVWAAVSARYLALLFLLIEQYLGLHDVAVLCKKRHERFLKRTSLLRHAVLCSLRA